MKAYIGPYPGWWRSYFYVDYMDKKYNHDWNGPHNIFEKVLEKTAEALDWCYSVTINKYFARKERKIKIHIDDYDVWGLDHTLSLIILPALKKLKEVKHGSPHVDDEDVPEHLRSTTASPKENEWDTDEFWHQRWVYVLDEMIYAFEHIADGEWDMEIYRRGGDQWTDEGLAETKAIQDRINKGTLLFGKYYQALWD